MQGTPRPARLHGPTGPRAWRRHVSAAVLAAAVGALGACGPGEADGRTQPAGFDASAEVDTATGTIVLPVERFMVSRTEQDELMSARALAMARCSTERGLPTTYEPIRMAEGSDRRYGVWFRPEAERFGYGLPQPTESAEPAPADDAVGEDAVEQRDALRVYEECARTTEVSRLSFEHIRPAFDYEEAFGAVTETAEASDATTAALAEWEACLARHGLERDPSISPWAVKGASAEPSEANIVIALDDVGCKEETSYIERMAASEAAVQAPVVEEHLAELTEMRQEYEDALETARAYLRENAP